MLARRLVSDDAIDTLADRLAQTEEAKVTSDVVDTAEFQTAAVSLRLIGRAVAGIVKILREKFSQVG
jgi:hypothetical protein